MIPKPIMINLINYFFHLVEQVINTIRGLFFLISVFYAVETGGRGTIKYMNFSKALEYSDLDTHN